MGRGRQYSAGLISSLARHLFLTVILLCFIDPLLIILLTILFVLAAHQRQLVNIIMLLTNVY